MNPQQGAQQGAQQPPLHHPAGPPGLRPAARAPVAAAARAQAAPPRHMAPARAAPRVRQDSLTTLPPPARAAAPAAQPSRTPGSATCTCRATRTGTTFLVTQASRAGRRPRRPRRRRRPRPSPRRRAAAVAEQQPRRAEGRPGGARAGAGAERRRDPGRVPARAGGAAAGQARRAAGAASPVAWPAPSPPPAAVTGVAAVAPSALSADPPTGVTYRASRFAGCCWDARIRKWRANIQVKGYRIPLGDFEDEADAARAYDAARTKWKALMKSVKVPLNFPNSGIDEKTLAALPPLPPHYDRNCRRRRGDPTRRSVVNARPPPRPSPEKGAFPGSCLL